MKSTPRSPSTPQPALQAVLADAAGDPIRRALWLDALEQQLRPYLPPALVTHCRLANVAGERLVFIVDSPIWRAKLRLASVELLAAAQSVGLTVTEVTVKTTTAPLHPDAGTATPAIPIAQASRKALAAVLALLDSPDSTGTQTGSHRRHRR